MEACFERTAGLQQMARRSASRCSGYTTSSCRITQSPFLQFLEWETVENGLVSFMTHTLACAEEQKQPRAKSDILGKVRIGDVFIRQRHPSSPA